PTDPRQPLLALGLDSVAVIQLKHRIDTELLVTLSLGSVLAGASLADLVEQVSVQLEAPISRQPAVPDRTPAADATGVVAAPMSFGQRWMWYLQNLEPDSPTY